jgi:hypothetical protein
MSDRRSNNFFAIRCFCLLLSSFQFCKCFSAWSNRPSALLMLGGTYQQGCQLRGYDMNGRFQMQGGKNWFFPKEVNANRFFWDSHWLEIWSNNFCPSMGPNGGSVATDSGQSNGLITQKGPNKNIKLERPD